jgi:hypothetical protein
VFSETATEQVGFLSFTALTFIENSMAGNDRNLDIPGLLTYNLFVIFCPA